VQAGVLVNTISNVKGIELSLLRLGFGSGIL